MRRGIFGASRKEVNGSGETKQWGGYWPKLPTQYFSIDQIEKNEMCLASNSIGEKRGVYSVLGEN
jgi:hypothetical protein